MTTVDEAREALRTFRRNADGEYFDREVDALIAAVRAEYGDPDANRQELFEQAERADDAEAKLAALREAGDAMADAWLGERRRNHWEATPLPVEDWRAALAATPAEEERT